MSLNAYLKTHLELPEELKQEFELSNILSIKNTSILCTLKKKLPLSEDAFILKIIPRKQYDAALFKKLSGLSGIKILKAIQTYQTKRFLYFIFPKLQSLTYLVKSGKMNFHTIQQLSEDISETLEYLHRCGIFHMDISPGNIYRNAEGHFVLGDFSSAKNIVNTEIIPNPFHKTGCRTGSTKGFYPKPAPNFKQSPANFDIYGFCMILFLLLNHGKEEKKDTPIESTEIEHIKQFLLTSQKRCQTEILEPDFSANFTIQLIQLFSEVKEQKTLFYTTKISHSDFETSLFCSFTEPERKCFASFYNYRFPNKTNVFFKENQIRFALYGALMLCGSIFLLACYHSFSSTQKSKSTVMSSLSQQETSWKTSGSYITTDVENLNTIHPSPENSITPSSSPEVPNIENSIKTTEPVFLNIEQQTLNISNQKLYDTSFVSQVKHPETIITIFAQKNNFINISPFLSFRETKELYLHQNPISSIQGLKELKHLEILDLSDTKLQNLSFFPKLQHLKILDLSGQKHLKRLDKLKQLQTLEYLLLTNTGLSRKQITALQKALPKCTILY